MSNAFVTLAEVRSEKATSCWSLYCLRTAFRTVPRRRGSVNVSIELPPARPSSELVISCGSERALDAEVGVVGSWLICQGSCSASTAAGVLAGPGERAFDEVVRRATPPHGMPSVPGGGRSRGTRQCSGKSKLDWTGPESRAAAGERGRPKAGQGDVRRQEVVAFFVDEGPEDRPAVEGVGPAAEGVRAHLYARERGVDRRELAADFRAGPSGLGSYRVELALPAAAQDQRSPTCPLRSSADAAARPPESGPQNTGRRNLQASPPGELITWQHPQSFRNGSASGEPGEPP